MGELEAKDIKYGLIAIDRRELESDEDNKEAVILHFCGFDEKPTQHDIEVFFNTMATTPELGVMDIMEFIDVYDAETSIIEQYKNDLINGVINEVKINENGNTISTLNNSGAM